ncbi:hypothetical protein [Chloroflexus sp.]|uniref:hypothetical protein n=1 Tax=Chloroflexus sp. TaxID=1904827 RepID=UPI002ACD7D2C|nr:hypothetical protein [Chloroflexus sp.]
MLSRRCYQLTFLERLAFFLFTFDSLVFNSLLPPLFGQTLAQRWHETVKDDIWLMMVVCALAFHLLRYRIAMAFTIGFYSLSVAIVGGQMVFASLQGINLEPGWRVLQVYASVAVFLGFIYVMRSSAGAAVANRVCLDERVGAHRWVDRDRQPASLRAGVARSDGALPAVR